MSIELTSTNASAVAAALLSERRKAGSPAMGMVMTFLVVTDESGHYDALKVARAVAREHPARILGIIRRSARGRSNLDAELTIGGSGESVLLRMSGELTRHAESVVLPLLLPDSPVVVWWPRNPPDDPAADPIGQLAQRRITDAAATDRGRTQAILTQARSYADGNTDLSWTRLTPWRALLAAALDQYPAKVSSAKVEAERTNPSADLMVAWLSYRLRVDVTRTVSKGPGITSVVMETGGGAIEICRPDGLLAEFSIPNAPNRPVALKRREMPELLAEELRRLDPDDIYEETVHELCRLVDQPARGSGREPGTSLPRSGSRSTTAASAPGRSSERTTTKRGAAAKKSATSKSSATKASAAKSAAAKSSTSKRTATKRTATKRAAANQSGTKRAASKRSATKRGATKAARRS